MQVRQHICRHGLFGPIVWFSAVLTIGWTDCFLGLPYRSAIKSGKSSCLERASLPASEDPQTFLISTTCSARRSKALSSLSAVCAPQVRIFKRDDENGARGCYTSHLSIYKEAVEKGLPWALVMEDNLMLALEPSEVQLSIAGLMKWVSAKKTQWSVLHLSLVHSAASLRLRPCPSTDLPHGQLLKVERTAPDWYGPVQISRAPGLGTTAYFISREAIEAMLKYDLQRGYVAPIDDVLAEPCY